MIERSPRILLVTRNLPPLVGGMERLNWHIADELSRHAEVRVIGPEGAAALRPRNVEINEVWLRPLWRFLLTSAWRAIRIGLQWRPDFVLGGSGLLAPAVWIAARVSGAKAGVYLHGLDVAVRHPLYRLLWHAAIRHMDVVVVNSSATRALAAGIGVDSSCMHTVHPGVQMPEAPRPASSLHDFRSRHGLGDGPLLLSIGRLTTRKGLREFVQYALPAIVHAMPDTLLVIIGDAPHDSLHAGVQTPDSIQEAADVAGVGRHLRFLGVITDPMELANAYESAALHVFPVRELPGDPEGFGMVAIEAAAHGVMTVAFATGGVVDAVAEGRSGQLVRPGDYTAFSRAVLQVLSGQSSASGSAAIAFSHQFAWPAFGDKLRLAMLQDSESREGQR